MRRQIAALALALVAVYQINTGAQAPTPTTKPAVVAAASDRARAEQAAAEAGQPVNIRVDVAIIDEVGTNTTTPKTLMMMLADRSGSNIRVPFDDRTVSMDALPTILNGRVRLKFTIVLEGKSAKGPTRHAQSMTTMLDSGKPLVVMESLDPADGNRKMMIELKATILK